MVLSTRSLRIAELTAADVRDHLRRDNRLIVPLGACDQYGPHLPIGASTLIAEAFANQLSQDFGVLRAPSLPFGVNVPTLSPFPGAATVREKTLHAFLNDLLASWEDVGFAEFILLTVQDYDSHVEAVATVTGTHARVRVIEALNMDFSAILDSASSAEHGGEALTSLMLFLYPDKVRMDRAHDFAPGESAVSTLRRISRIPAGSAGSLGHPTLATPEKGRLLFEYVCDRIRTRVFTAPE
jgi:creatinine amidohydrolase